MDIEMMNVKISKKSHKYLTKIQGRIQYKQNARMPYAAILDRLVQWAEDEKLDLADILIAQNGSRKS